MKRSSFIIATASLLIISCSSLSEEEYGKNYCDCMIENNGNMKKCKEILDDAKGNLKDEGSKQSFLKAYEKCMAER